MSVDFQEILESAICDITQRLSGISLEKAITADKISSEIASLCAVTSGSYQITIICHGELQLFRRIAEKMKRRPIENDDEVEMYLKEYFNIVCGHVISRVNSATKESARFGIPQYHRGFYYADGCRDAVVELSFHSNDGRLIYKAAAPLEG